MDLSAGVSGTRRPCARFTRVFVGGEEESDGDEGGWAEEEASEEETAGGEVGDEDASGNPMACSSRREEGESLT